MKAKVIEVKHRDTSETYPEWMKYEITLLYPDGKKEKIPAYGRDLQDALNRIVKNNKVKRFEVVPFWMWAIIWFTYLFMLILLYKSTNLIGFIYFGIGIIMIIPIFQSFFKKKSKKH